MWKLCWNVDSDHTVLTATIRLQLFVVLWDSGNAEMEVSTLMTISVRRNEYMSTFLPFAYSVQISEHVSVGTVITTVKATDDDLPITKIS